MKIRLTLLLFTLFIFSCKPSFELNRELPEIKKNLEEFSIENTSKQFEYFFPEEYWINKNKDSILSIFENIHFENPEYFSDYTTSFIKHSKVINTKKAHFILVNINESFHVSKSQFNNIHKEISTFFDNENINYTNSSDKLIVNNPKTILGLYYEELNKWTYYNFNAKMLLDAYGLKTSKKIINAYFDEAFSPSEKSWSKEEVNDFKETYSEIKNQKQYQNLDFDEYCNCLIKFQEKIPIDISSNYFESTNFKNNISICRIYAAINSNKKL